MARSSPPSAIPMKLGRWSSSLLSNKMSSYTIIQRFSFSQMEPGDGRVPRAYVFLKHERLRCHEQLKRLGETPWTHLKHTVSLSRRSASGSQVECYNRCLLSTSVPLRRGRFLMFAMRREGHSVVI